MSCTQKQQLVCFPKVRVLKRWFRHFNDHKEFHNEGTVHLFSLMALFSYANFRSNERVINGDRYMEAPGQWICKLGSLPRILRVHSKAQALELIPPFMSLGISLTYNFILPKGMAPVVAQEATFQGIPAFERIQSVKNLPSYNRREVVLIWVQLGKFRFYPYVSSSSCWISSARLI